LKNNFSLEEEKDSHKIHINVIIDIKEIKDPKEDTIFQVAKASG
jgi:hypothetical protein